jgi:hypothetical protein
MTQVYHSNVTTNKNMRLQIQCSSLSDVELSVKYHIDVKTVAKHSVINFTEDKSSRPHNIKYSLPPLDKGLIRVIRKLTSIGLDDLVDTV